MRADPEFDDFVAAHSTALLRTAYLLTGDRGHAEDGRFRVPRILEEEA